MKALSGIAIFSIKAAIVALLLFLAVKMLLPDMNNLKEDWKAFFSKRENQALVFSFIQNPVALNTAGERDFDRKNYSDAALKFELAIGLLEMHGASSATIEPYQTRFIEATQLAKQPATK